MIVKADGGESTRVLRVQVYRKEDYMPLIEHLLSELEKLVERRPNTRLPGEEYDEIWDKVTEAAGDDDGEDE